MTPERWRIAITPVEKYQHVFSIRWRLKPRVYHPRTFPDRASAQMFAEELAAEHRQDYLFCTVEREQPPAVPFLGENTNEHNHDNTTNSASMEKCCTV